MRIAVTGSSGMIGTALVAALRADGHDVIRLLRHDSPADTADGTARHWAPFGEPDPKPFEGCDVVVHLAGAGLGDKRWTAAYLREIRESRIHGTDSLARSLALCAEPPAALLSASAIGYYGDTGDTPVAEGAPPADDFLGTLCQQWEAATRPAEDAGIAVAHLRSGVVLDASGGALARMLPPFRLGLGGPIAGGRQWFSFIGMADYLAAVRHIMVLTHGGELTGAVNVTGPDPVPNREFTKALGTALHRPALLPIPGFALRVLFGKMAAELTGSQRVVPARLLDSGFAFRTPDAASALAAAVRGAAPETNGA
jgi:uncharacterized protein (TIGR01777 family)